MPDKRASIGKTVLFCLWCLASACGAGETWRGEYRYEAAAGRTAGGSPMVVEYRLYLSDGGCRLSVQGYQVDETLLCRSVESGDGLEVRFESYAGGSPANVYGVRVYKPGETLFVLSRTGGRMLTRWKALRPEGAGAEGRYFVRRD